MNSLKILHCVEYYYPSVGGAQEVVKQLSERLVQLGHDVTVATSRLPEREFRVYNGVKIEEFNVAGNRVRGMSGEVDRYQRYLKESEFDIIMNYAAQQWTTDAMLPIIGEIKAKKVFVPCGFSGLYNRAYKEYFSAMKEWMKQYDTCVFLSNEYRDIEFARKNLINNIVVIPNGAGKDEFLNPPKIDIKKFLGIPDDHYLILHVGSHTGEKGHAELLEIFRKARINNATLLLVANSFQTYCTQRCLIASKLYNLFLSGFSNKKIIVKELSREETVAAYHAADLFLFPSNIECSPLVLFEAMASKTPFLTTDVGNAGEIIRWSNGGILLPTDKEGNGYVKARILESVKMLEEIYSSSDLIQALAGNGYRAWLERFTWEDITCQYEALYTRLVSQS